ncbi:MAG: UDP-N-acetylmuramoyl-L-alanine--D-glutamate ligase [Maricaulis sp.]|jgi:UDP-N-acetylmuramoylalanine--D-glutamate ligase|nr:UDP-N-acetylmuramoyl-L-alanine--D-glutamate ligase [Maricaulis sp.]
MIAINAYEGRRVAVLGLGRSGIATARALEAGGASVVCWDDGEVAREAAAAEGLELADLNRRDWGDIAALILSPGIPLTHPKPHRVVELAQAVGADVIGDIELFALTINAMPAKRRPKIIGITGTNGKSTTTALIGHILTEAGRTVHVGGNIGAAILTLDPPKPGTIYVLELSSYQIDLTFSLKCDVALLLNISPDHIDRHGSFDGYFAAKQRLFAMQETGGAAVIGVDDAQTADLFSRLRRARPTSEVTAISSGRVIAEGVYALGGDLYDSSAGQAEPVADLTRARALPGKHNAQNAAAALAVVLRLGVSARTAGEAILSFGGLAHRQEAVAEIDGVRFINDSKATNADATAMALACYDNIYWIAGGVAKGGGLDALANSFGNIRKAFLIGEAEATFAAELDGRVECERCGHLDRAVELAQQAAKRSGHEDAVVLFSPAAASFDQFANFEDRGEAFRARVAALTQNTVPVS